MGVSVRGVVNPRGVVHRLNRERDDARVADGWRVRCAEGEVDAECACQLLPPQRRVRGVDEQRPAAESHERQQRHHRRAVVERREADGSARLEIQRAEPKRVRLIDAAQPQPRVDADVRTIVEEFLRGA